MTDILMDRADGVLTLTLNRVEKKNSFTQAMYTTMAEALAEALADAAIRVVVIQGHATVFSAGNDLRDFLNGPPVSASSQAPVQRFIAELVQFPKPLLAAVCGPAVGIGTTMLFHCDVVYAGDNAAFSMPFVNLGLCPEAASSLLAPRLMGYHRAAEALLMGEPFMAEAAQELGLVNRIVPPTEANGLAQAQARKLAAKPMRALIETKRLLKKSQTAAITQRVAEEFDSFGRMLKEPAALEAIAAFTEKRRPDFSGL